MLMDISLADNLFFSFYMEIAHSTAAVCRAIRQKKIAPGHWPDGHEETVTYNMPTVKYGFLIKFFLQKYVRCAHPHCA